MNRNEKMRIEKKNKLLRAQIEDLCLNFALRKYEFRNGFAPSSPTRRLALNFAMRRCEFKLGLLRTTWIGDLH